MSATTSAINDNSPASSTSAAIASDSTQPAQSTSDRIHYLDNLRALAMMLGVLLHAGLAYANPAQSIWIATDTTSSKTVDAGIWFIHLFRMGLFFCFLVTLPS